MFYTIYPNATPLGGHKPNFLVNLTRVEAKFDEEKEENSENN